MPLSLTPVGQRWTIAGNIALQWDYDDAVFLDIGPYAEEPSDAECARAVRQLAGLGIPGLVLGPSGWVWDFDVLAAAVPEFARLQGVGKRSREPRFETMFLDSMRPGVATLRLKFPVDAEAQDQDIEPISDEELTRLAVPTETPEASSSPVPTPAPAREGPLSPQTLIFTTSMSIDQCKQALKAYPPIAAPGQNAIFSPDTANPFAALVMDDRVLVRYKTSSEWAFNLQAVITFSNEPEDTVIYMDAGTANKSESTTMSQWLVVAAAASALLYGFFQTSIPWMLGGGLCLAIWGVQASSNEQSRTAAYQANARPFLDRLTRDLRAEPVEQASN